MLSPITTDTGARQPKPPKGRPSKGSLKEFVEKFKDRHYYVVEMRIVLICCIAVFFKLFFSEVITEADEHPLTYSALTFIGCECSGGYSGKCLEMVVPRGS